MIDTEKYLAGRYVEGGRVWPEIDCYGLILIVRDDLGLPEWPIFDGVTKRENGLHRLGTKLARQVERCEPCHGAVAACYASGLMSHVAIVVETPHGLAVLECNPGTNVTAVPLRRFMRRFVRVEFYR